MGRVAAGRMAISMKALAPIQALGSSPISPMRTTTWATCSRNSAIERPGHRRRSLSISRSQASTSTSPIRNSAPGDPHLAALGGAGMVDRLSVSIACSSISPWRRPCGPQGCGRSFRAPAARARQARHPQYDEAETFYAVRSPGPRAWPRSPAGIRCEGADLRHRHARSGTAGRADPARPTSRWCTGPGARACRPSTTSCSRCATPTA